MSRVMDYDERKAIGTYATRSLCRLGFSSSATSGAKTLAFSYGTYAQNIFSPQQLFHTAESYESHSMSRLK